MTDKTKTVVFAGAILGLGLAWGVWAEWPEIRGDRDQDEAASRVAALVKPEPAAPLQPAGKEIEYNFDRDDPGQRLTGFHEALTGRGQPPHWNVQADSSAPSPPNVLAQTSADKTDYRFPVAIADDGVYRDLQLSVQFKAVSGEVDRAGGLVFRLKDANNYYIARANALENNLNLYKVVDGRRSKIDGARVIVETGRWHELRVEAIGDRITCYLDGAKKFEAVDSSFTEPGKIGVWTKADSVTYFDNLRVTAR